MTATSKHYNISIVLPTYNRAGLLRNALESLSGQVVDGNCTVEIIVVDNASTDDTRKVVEELSAGSSVRVRYVCEHRRGYPYALNRGVIESTADWVAFFDDDELAQPTWLMELFNVAIKESAGVVGGSVILKAPEEELENVGPVCRSLFGKAYSGEPRICRGRDIPSGGNMLVSRVVLESVGSFDTTMAAGGCDTDLVRRARTAGFGVWNSPNAVVHHNVSPSRLEIQYLRWVSVRFGLILASVDCKLRGRTLMVLLCIARIGQAVVINLLGLCVAYLKQNVAAIRDRQCLLWRAVGYTRGCMLLLAPGVCPQKGFLDTLDFREKRKSIDW